MRLSRKDDFISICQQGWKFFQEAKVARMDTAYKRVNNKVKPVNSDQSDGSIPGGLTDWKSGLLEKEALVLVDPNRKYAEWFTPKFSTIKRGSQLTAERLSIMTVGTEMTLQERDVLIEMLYNQEAGIAFAFEEMGMVRHEVAPPQEICTIPHEAWQTQGFAISKALIDIGTKMLRERLDCGLLEPCYGPYRNPWFIVKKKEAGKY